jgi:aspartate ammonia-lyase
VEFALMSEFRRLVCRTAGRIAFRRGKANPVTPEVVNEVAFAVTGHDVTVTRAPSTSTGESS